MGDVPMVRTTRRRFWLCIIMVFLGGLVCGGLAGVYGIRYVYLNYPPPLERLAGRAAKKIQRDFNLDETTYKRVRGEIVTMVLSVHRKMTEAREDTGGIIQQYTDNIADMMPDDASRERWLKDARNYVPVPPPMPKPPKQPTFDD